MEEQSELFKVATGMLAKAYVPYSKFQVGAAVLTKDGKIYGGCNIENASYGLANCGERTAIFKAVSEGHRELKSICITGNTKEPIQPCGACRQVMAEFFAPAAKVYLTNQTGAKQETTVGALLPGAFTNLD